MMLMDRQPPENQQATQTTWEFKPGDTISPRTGAPAPATPPEAAPDPPQVDLPPPPIPAGPEAVPEPEIQSPQPVMQSTGDSISWTASEYIAHQKSPSWYALVILVAAALAAITYLITRDKITTGVVVACGVALAAYGTRKPRQLQYVLDGSGLTIGLKHYVYEQFRSFSVIDEGPFSSITFMPMKRFAPMAAMYYDPKDEAKIVAILSDKLPMENRQFDVVDRFMRRIRF